MKAGERVSFTAYIELPERAGDVEKAIWDFEADNEFLPNGTIGITQWGEDGIGRAIAVAEHIFTRPGIYFPVVKVASNRTFGDQFTCVWNQARIRVVVKE